MSHLLAKNSLCNVTEQSHVEDLSCFGTVRPLGNVFLRCKFFRQTEMDVSCVVKGKSPLLIREELLFLFVLFCVNALYGK
jgi:hypothetical protein